MKEADKNLLKEIAHLSRLIKKKEKVGHASKHFHSFKPQNKYNVDRSVPAGNKFKFIKRAVTVDKFKFSEPSAVPVSKFKFYKTNPASNLSNFTAAGNVKESPAEISPTIPLSIPQNDSIDLRKNGAVSNCSGKIFVNPKIFSQVTNPLSMASGVCIRNVPLPVDDPTVNNNPAKGVTFSSSQHQQTSNRQRVKGKLNSQRTSIGQGQDLNSLYKFSKPKVTDAVNSVGDVSNKQQNSFDNREREKDKIDSNFAAVKKVPRKSLSTSIALSTSTSTSDSSNIKSNSNESSKAKLVQIPPKSYSKYKLDRRTKFAKHSTSTWKGGLKGFRGSDAKSPNKKYIVTRHSLRKLKESPKRIILAGSCRLLKKSKCTGASSSRIVKIQGTTYESRNKGKSLKRIRTSSFSQLSCGKVENKFCQKPITKLASQVLKKSKTTLLKNRQKKNVFCKFYNMFGVCKRRDDGTCRFVHDDRQVLVCSRFIVGKCDNESCTLSHNLKSGKIPPCRFFKIGRCTRTSCPYSHVIPKKKNQQTKPKLSVAPIENSKSKKEVVNVLKKLPIDDKTILEKKNHKNHEKSRYYQRLPNSNPVRSVIPRRLPPSLAKRLEDEFQDEDVSDMGSDESENSCISNDVESECDDIKKEDIVVTKRAPKSSIQAGFESCNSILQSVAIMTSTTSNPHLETLSCDKPISDSTSEKRMRLLGLQNNLKKRAAAIRNENLDSDK